MPVRSPRRCPRDRAVSTLGAVGLVALGWLALGSCRQLVPAPGHEPILPAWQCYEQGERLRLAGRPDEAAARYEQAVEIDPLLTEAQRELQNLEIGLCRRPELLRHYRRLREERPDSAVFQYLVGRIETDPERQRARFLEATRLDPAYPWGHFGLGVVYERQGRPRGALLRFRRALEADPSFVPALLGSARALLALGRAGDALPLLTHAASLAPGRPGAALALASGFARAERYSEALAAALPALRAAPTSPAVHRTIQSLLDRGATPVELREIREILEGLVRTGPVNPVVHLTRALVSRALGEPVRAVRELRTGLAQGGDPGDFAGPLRDLDLRIRDYPGALEAWRMRIPDRVVLDPANPYRERFADLYRLLEGARRDGAPGDLHRRLGEALARVGWLAPAERELRIHLLNHAGDEDAAQFLEDLRRHRSFLKALGAWVRRGYARFADTGIGPGLREYVEGIYDQGMQTLGKDLRGGGALREYPLLGSLLVPGFEEESALSRQFDRFGQVIVVGRQAGGPPETVVAGVLALTPGPLAGRFLCTNPALSYQQIIVRTPTIPSYRESLGSGVAGVALGTFVLVNFDVVLDWERAARRGVEGAWEDPSRLLEASRPLPQPDPAGEDPVGNTDCADRKLILRAYRERAARMGGAAADPFRSDYELFLGIVEAHEYGHLLDFRRFVPLLAHPLRALGILLDLGLSRSRVQEYLEGDAQLVAIALAPSPHAALAQTVTSAMEARLTPPHSAGYYRICRDWIRYLRGHADRFPAIDPSTNLIQQLHLLGEDEVRRIARVLAGRRGIELAEPALSPRRTPPG